MLRLRIAETKKMKLELSSERWLLITDNSRIDASRLKQGRNFWARFLDSFSERPRNMLQVLYTTNKNVLAVIYVLSFFSACGSEKHERITRRSAQMPGMCSLRARLQTRFKYIQDLNLSPRPFAASYVMEIMSRIVLHWHVLLARTMFTVAR